MSSKQRKAKISRQDVCPHSYQESSANIQLKVRAMNFTQSGEFQRS